MAGRAGLQEMQGDGRMAQRLRARLTLPVRTFRGSGRWVAIVFLGVLAAGCASEPPAPMSTVTGFDLQRYLGEWHQVAAIPAWFQSDCVTNTRANYSLGDDGLMEVLNSCQTANGSINQAEARARFLASDSDGKLEVTFVEVLGAWVWPAAGDYWILGLDADYAWSIVGEPSREFAWVLARSRTLDTETLRNIRQILEREGYDSCALQLTTTDETGRLCDVTI